jgi:hypothetical protein
MRIPAGERVAASPETLPGERDSPDVQFLVISAYKRTDAR